MERIFEVKVLGMTLINTWPGEVTLMRPHKFQYSILKSLRIFRHPLTSNFNNHCHGLHIWQSEKSHSGKNLRSENESALSIDLSGCLDGSFTQQSGKAFNEMSLNVKNIVKYETFSAKCYAYYFDKAIACFLSENKWFYFI